MPVGGRLTIREFAEYLGVSVQRVHQLIEKYEIPIEPVHARSFVVKKSIALKFAKRERPPGVHKHKPKDDHDQQPPDKK